MSKTAANKDVIVAVVLILGLTLLVVGIVKFVEKNGKNLALGAGVGFGAWIAAALGLGALAKGVGKGSGTAATETNPGAGDTNTGDANAGESEVNDGIEDGENFDPTQFLDEAGNVLETGAEAGI